MGWKDYVYELFHAIRDGCGMPTKAKAPPLSSSELEVDRLANLLKAGDPFRGVPAGLAPFFDKERLTFLCSEVADVRLPNGCPTEEGK